MFIEPITCPRCGRTGRPAEEGFQSSTDADGVLVHCQCGETITLRGGEARDQQMLSANIFARLSAASNHTESGTVRIAPGRAHDVAFAKAFDFPCRAFLTPDAMVALKEAFLAADRMQILSSVLPSHQKVPDSVEVSWLVFGLVEIDSLPTWYVHFYGALTQLANGFYKPALVDYAVAFEAFTEAFLAEHLTRRVGEQVADYLLRRTARIEDRVKDLLELAIGVRLSSRADVYRPWDEHVRGPRNRLAHGARIAIDRDAANRAHAASYQAIRWIQAQASSAV